MCFYPYEEMSASFDGDNHRDHGFCSLVQILGLGSTRVCYRLLVFEEASVHDQASEIANDHHTCDHRDHFAKERDDERIPKEISHSDTEAP